MFTTKHQRILTLPLCRVSTKSSILNAGPKLKVEQQTKENNIMDGAGECSTAATVKKVVYGRPYIQVVTEEVRSRNSKVLLLASKTLGSKSSLVADLEDALGDQCLGNFSAIREHTPDDDVVALAKKIKEVGADTVITFGGGSMTDAAKAVKVALGYKMEKGAEFQNLRPPASGPVFTFLESTFKTDLTVINVPTTLSAGEFSGITGVKDLQSGSKFGYVHPALCADVAVLDPAVTVYTPDWLFLSTGVRAVDHSIETLCSISSNLYADTLALKALSLLAEGLKASSAEAEKANGGPNMEARLKCFQGAWLSMQGITQGVPMGASHGIGHALGSLGVPHGYTSCVMLPYVMKYNFDKIPEGTRDAITEAVGYDKTKFTPQEAVYDFLGKLGMPQTLKDVGIKMEQIDEVVNASLQSNWFKANIKQIPADDLHQMLNNIYDGIF